MFDFGQLITSRQNPTVKRVCALTEKKKRYAEELFRFDGLKLFDEAIGCGLIIEYAVLSKAASESVKDRVATALREGKIDLDAILFVDGGVFAKISEESSPEGIITVARFPSELHRRVSAGEHRVADGERILIAESLRDAGNLGTVVRSCAALGIDRLIISDDCADLYNPKTIRAAMGGLFRLPIDIVRAGELPEFIGLLRASGRRVFAAALRADALEIGKFSFCGRDCFVIGNEGHGLSQTVVEACDACAVIPMTEGSESLNAAAAAAICIWETVKG